MLFRSGLSVSTSLQSLQAAEEASEASRWTANALASRGCSPPLIYMQGRRWTEDESRQIERNRERNTDRE